MIIQRAKGGSLHYAAKFGNAGNVVEFTTDRKKAGHVTDELWAKIKGYYTGRLNGGDFTLFDGRRVVDRVEGAEAVACGTAPPIVPVLTVAK